MDSQQTPASRDAGKRDDLGAVAAPQTEWEVRQELATAYRIVHDLGWSQTIFNHITARIPGVSGQFLINPFGSLYEEITASSLVKIDIEGNVLDNSGAVVNRGGFVIHAAIHRARPDAHYILHTHSPEGMAVACTEAGLSPHNFYGAMLSGQIGYHDFEGVTLNLGEQPRLLASMGDKSFLILRNHGLLTVGGTAAAMLFRMYWLQLACELQVLTDGLNQPMRQLSDEVIARCIEQQQVAARGFGAEQSYGRELFEALRRRVEARDPSFLK